MGCASSRNEDLTTASVDIGNASPISASSFPDKIHVCRMKSTISIPNVERKRSDLSRTPSSKMHPRARVNSLNASASTDASLPRAKLKYQKERRYIEA